MADYHEGKFYHLSGTLKEHFLEELFLMHIGKYEKQILFSELVSIPKPKFSSCQLLVYV